MVVNEEDGTATLVVSIDQVLGEDLTIDFTTGDDTANGSDFAPTNGTITIPAGQLSATLTFPILDDSAAESNDCLLYTSPSPRDQRGSRMPSSA